MTVSSPSTTPSHNTGENIPHAEKFYDHNSYISGQNLIYVLYADEKTTYPLGFRLYEKNDKRRVELAIDLVDELIAISVLADTELLMLCWSGEFVTHLEGHKKE